MELTEQATKKCLGCGAVKPLNEFYKQKAGRMGRRSRCKPCINAENEARRPRYREANRARGRRHYAENREAYRAAYDAWYAENREWRAEYSRRRRQVNPERHAENYRNWRIANPEKARERGHKRRAQKRQTETGPVDTDALWQHYGGNCALCYTKIDRSLRHPDPMSASLDHAVPLSKGGTHTQDNLQWTHLTCNVRKGNRD